MASAFAIKSLKIGLVGLLLMAIGCSRTEETYEANYVVLNTAKTAVEYRITYLDVSGTSITKGPLDTNYWKSPVYEAVEKGTIMKLSIEILQGEGDFELYIQRDGATHKQADFSSLSTTASIEAEI